jgi:DNA-binding ferritin-like protein
MKLTDKIKPSVTKATVPQLVAELLESSLIVHKMHLIARSRSYAEHQALGGFYDEISDFADSIYEQFAGQTSTVEIPDAMIIDNNPITYLEKLAKFVEQVHSNSAEYSHLQNQMDEVKSLIYGTLYKLKYLK